MRRGWRCWLGIHWYRWTTLGWSDPFYACTVCGQEPTR